MKPDINPMHAARRCKARSKRTGLPCKSPAKTGWTVCRMHGAGGGAPLGTRNGNYRHGNETRMSKALRAEMITLVRGCSEIMNLL